MSSYYCFNNDDDEEFENGLLNPIPFKSTQLGGFQKDIMVFKILVSNKLADLHLYFENLDF